MKEVVAYEDVFGDFITRRWDPETHDTDETFNVSKHYPLRRLDRYRNTSESLGYRQNVSFNTDNQSLPYLNRIIYL